MHDFKRKAWSASLDTFILCLYIAIMSMFDRWIRTNTPDNSYIFTRMVFNVPLRSAYVSS